MTNIKICGLNSVSSVRQSVACGADYVGFVFYKKSPRYVNIESAKRLSKLVPSSVKKVGLFVNPTNRDLEEILKETSLDYLQLHGGEAPQIVKEIRASFGIPIIKAIGISEKSDLAEIKKYENICDQLLIDNKPSPSMNLPGGNGLTFDWGLVSSRYFNRPWFLAGGLNSSNIKDAIEISGAKQVDVSSGVELEVGLKDNSKIADFINTVKMGV